MRQMARQLPLLVGGPGDRPVRQQTLRSAIAWSYDLLPAAAQTLFRGLGVFGGGGELAEIAAVVGVDDPEQVAALLDHLLDHSLLRGEEVSDRLRYTMLEAIREYASEQLAEAGEAAAVQRRHAWTYVALAEVLEPRLQGPEQAAALARLDQEYPNLRAALAWALDAGEAELAQRLAAAPWRYWALRGLVSEGRAWLARVRAAAPERTVGWAAAARVAGVLAQAQADYPASRALLEAVLVIYQAAGDTPHIAQVLNNLGLTVLEEGDVAAARAYFTASLAQHQAGGTLWGEAVALANLGMLAAEEQDWAATQPLLTAALQIFQRLGDERSVGIVRNNLGSHAYQQGHYDEAQRIWTECLARQEALDDHEGRALSFSHLAVVARDRGDWATAVAYTAAALTAFQELGDRRRLAHTLIHAAGLAVCQG